MENPGRVVERGLHFRHRLSQQLWPEGLSGRLLERIATERGGNTAAARGNQFAQSAQARDQRKVAEITSVQGGYGESSQEGEILQHFGSAHDYRSQGVLGQ